MASSYVFWTIGLGALPTVMNPALAHLIRSEGYSRQASFGVAFGGILNMVLDPLFITDCICRSLERRLRH